MIIFNSFFFSSPLSLLLLLSAGGGGIELRKSERVSCATNTFHRPKREPENGNDDNSNQSCVKMVERHRAKPNRTQTNAKRIFFVASLVSAALALSACVRTRNN